MPKTPPKGGLQINRKIGEQIYVFMDGIAVIFELTEIRNKNATIKIIADKNRVAVRRGEMLKEEQCEL